MNRLVVDPRQNGKPDPFAMTNMHKAMPSKQEILPTPAIDDVEEEEIDLEYIIREKPKPKIVREFMQAQLDNIVGDEEELFNK